MHDEYSESDEVLYRWNQSLAYLLSKINRFLILAQIYFMEIMAVFFVQKFVEEWFTVSPRSSIVSSKLR